MSRLIYLMIFILLHSTLFAKETQQIKVQFSGNKIVGDKLILEALGVKEPSFFEFYKDDTPYIPKSKISAVDSTLKEFYRTQGFFNTDITLNESNATLTLLIKENRFIKVGEVNLSSDGINLEKIELFKKGERFNPTKFSELKMDIQKAILAEGYCNYEFENKAYVDLDKYRADISYFIKKNQPCKFGKITVKGLESIDDSIITSRLLIKEGRAFNTEDIQRIYTSLQKLEAFDSIVVNYNDKNGSIVPIDIYLKEREKNLQYKVGVGYDTNLGMRTTAALEKFNLFSDAKKLSVLLAYSSQLASIESELSIPSINILGYYFDYSTKLGYKVEKYYDSVDVNVLQGDMKIKQERNFINYYLGLGYEYADYSDRSGEASELSDSNLFLLYPYIEIVYDRRDSKLNPKNGYYFAGLFEYGLPYNDHARSYTKMMLEGRYIHTLDQLTLASVFKIGTINELQNITPEHKRFFAGGSFSNRAYGFNEIGVVKSSSEDSDLGGLTMANFSIEANYPIYDKLSGALFSDLSMISDGENKFDGEHITTVGGGVRYLTPIGPFKIDAGVNVNNSEQYGISFQLGQSF